MNKPEQKRVLSGNDRRLRIERRQFSYTLHLPERRSGGDRRGRAAAGSGIHFITAVRPGSVLAA